MIYGTDIRKKEFKGRCIVAFVDFLGFSNEIKNNWNTNKDNPLDRLRSFVRNINKSLSRQTSEFDRLPDIKHSYNGCRIKTFSDSTIVVYGFDEEPNKTQLLLGCLKVSQAVSYIWKKALKENFTIRGGVEFGDIYWGNDVIAGPSFVAAYELESKFAETSRVIFGEKLYYMLKAAIEDQNYNLSEHPRTFYAQLEKRLLHFLFCDSDSKIIVSPHTLYSSKKENLIKQLQEMQKECKLMKAMIKYVPLLNILHEDKNELTLADLGISRVKS